MSTESSFAYSSVFRPWQKLSLTMDQPSSFSIENILRKTPESHRPVSTFSDSESQRSSSVSSAEDGYSPQPCLQVPVASYMTCCGPRSPLYPAACCPVALPMEYQAMPIEYYHQAFQRLKQQEAQAKQVRKARPKKFGCKNCKATFSNKGQLRGHERIHTGERPFKCDFGNCTKDFTRNEELTRHKRIHLGIRPFKCAVCEKPFGRKDHLKKHLKTHERALAAEAQRNFALAAIRMAQIQREPPAIVYQQYPGNY